MGGAVVLVTGASGYVGGRLVPELERRGRRVRCLARHPDHVRPRVGVTTEVVAGDLLEAASLAAPLRGVDAACYLVHSMGSLGDFEAEDRRAALHFAAAAHAAGVRRIVYLGGLGREPGLSRHLRSRHEVGRILSESGVPTIELRASIVIGSGSLSFEMVRALVERLPLMVTPRWVSQPTQPLAVEDLVDYLVAALDIPLSSSTVVEIGGPDRVSYADLMREYARQRGLRRVMLRVPVLSPRLSSLWLALVTPLYARVGRELVLSTRNPTVVVDDSARRLFPGLRPRGVSEAIARALVHEDRAFAETRWSDALSSGDTRAWGGSSIGPRLVDSRSRLLPHPPGDVFRPVRRIGGATGWYYGDWLWRLRGLLDRLAGGVGLRRGRRDPEGLRPGDVLDFWRVEAFVPDTLLRLRAEMRLPGRAWLQFELEPEAGGTRLRQTAIFEPRGLAGLAYWYGLYPVHQIIFAGMLRGIASAASPPHGRDRRSPQ
jgi:uncharacterized protein YbjT (DUF2867 family)